MEDKSKLLDQLRIDRSDDPGIRDGGGSGRLIALGAALLIVAAASAGAWWWFRGSHGASADAGADAADAGAAGTAAAAAGTAGAQATSAPGTASTLDASGYVVAQRQATVSAKAIGKLIELDIEEGQVVHKGDVMARLDDTNTHAALDQALANLGQTRASLEAAKTALADATPIFQRTQEERKAGVISAQDFDAAHATFNATQSDLAVKQRMVDVAMAAVEVAQRAEDDMTVRAPFSGVVTVKAAQPGEIVSPMSSGGFTRTGIGTIVDMDSLEVDVDVSENFINRVRVGMPAVVKLTAYPDWEIPAQVIAIIPTADRSKATVTVRVGFKQKDPRILPEMGARVSFLADQPGKGAGQAGAGTGASGPVATTAANTSTGSPGK